MNLNLLGAGASQGLVTGLQAAFTAETGIQINGYFSAVGAIREKVLAGAPCDVVILSAALLDDLRNRELLDGPPVPLGQVRTGVAVPAGRPAPDISTPETLREALLAARGIYVPDMETSTAGIHVLRVLRQLRIEAAVQPHVRPFQNGATAMLHLSHATEANAIGITQVTEIRYTPGLTLAGALPDTLGLATTYSAAIRAGTPNHDAAQALVQRLTGPAAKAARLAGGFEPLPGTT